MSNPVFTGNNLFRKKPAGRSRRRWAEAGVQDTIKGASRAASGVQDTVPDSSWAQGSTAMGILVAERSRPMTVADVVTRTALLLTPMVAAAAAAWALVPVETIGLSALAAAGVAFTVGLVVNLAAPTNVPLIVTYALLEGVALGALSHVYDLRYDGLPSQALLATIVTAGTTLAVYKTGIVKVTGRFARFVTVATIAYAGYALLNLILLLVSPSASAFGPLYAGPWGVLVGLLAVLLACGNLLVDFEAITRAVERQAPARFAWTAAFGLIVTLAWMYLEILRLLARRR